METRGRSKPEPYKDRNRGDDWAEKRQHQLEDLILIRTVQPRRLFELPDAYLTGLLTHSRSIGVWGVTKLATDTGRWRQINRAGRPMIQPWVPTARPTIHAPMQRA